MNIVLRVVIASIVWAIMRELIRYGKQKHKAYKLNQARQQSTYQEYSSADEAIRAHCGGSKNGQCNQ